MERIAILMALLSYGLCNELYRCCREGESHFQSRQTCSGLSTSIKTTTCKRASSICCYRAMLESQCQDGEKGAALDSTCPANPPSQPGGVFKKECCDCCLLAKERSAQGKGCEVPADFSEPCRSTFSRCCRAAFSFTYATAVSSLEWGESEGDREGSCASRPCDQICEERDGRYTCKCRYGYELTSDGRTCSEAPTAAPVAFNDCPRGYEPSQDLACQDIDECAEGKSPCEGQFCLNTLGSYECLCNNGYSWNAETEACVDIDECLLLIDNCLPTQRCLNSPGSYRCIRTLGCGTGYILDSKTEDCIDVDECMRDSHNCGPTYTCRNTKGSFRCESKKCRIGEVLNSQGECTRIDCAVGLEPDKYGRCLDINECLDSFRCGQFEECVNTPGSFRCEAQRNSCGEGYRIDANTGACADIDECREGPPKCGSEGTCVNIDGGFKCRCQEGFDFDETTKQCEDIDECKRFNGAVCSTHAQCENTHGSFRCHCGPGFRLEADQRTCSDEDECATGKANCQQRCINVPGSYQCICNRGYSLSADGFNCQDIDECTLWSGAGSDLCMGGCHNTPGSYTCQCPTGYEMQGDGRTCKDINECTQGECSGNDRICVNTLGSYKCHMIRCPNNYVQDPKYKHRCNRPYLNCVMGDKECLKQPVAVTFRYISLPKLPRFPRHRSDLPLFTMKGPEAAATDIQFELVFYDAIPGRPTVELATRSSFLLQKGQSRNSAVIALAEPLDGPQDIELHLVMRIHNSGIFGGNAIAKLGIHVSEHRSNRSLVQDGFVCNKKCHPQNVMCVANHTMSISYQFASLPSLKRVSKPIEVTRVRAESIDRNPFYVKYIIDRSNARDFRVTQDRMNGIVELIGPIRGPQEVMIRLHMNIYSRSHVLVSHNVALISVDIARHYF